MYALGNLRQMNGEVGWLAGWVYSEIQKCELGLAVLHLAQLERVFYIEN